MKNESIIAELKHIVGEANVLLDDESRVVYGKDLTQQFTPNPQAIVFPTTENQVVSIVKFANKEKIALVPSGGRTGYSGGAVAMKQELVVSFKKFNRIIEFNAGDRQVRCEPGVTTKTIQDFALDNNFYYPVDFSSSGSSQIGGNIATNAGGIRVIRYGMTRNWVAGLRVVTGKGDVLDLNHGLIKNASGYDLRHLFIGSEGTLGFITEATLQLTTLPAEKKVCLFSAKNYKCLMEVLGAFNSHLSVTAFEFFSEDAMTHVISATGLKHPFHSKSYCYILMEYESNEKDDKIVLEISEKCLNDGWVDDVLVSQHVKQVEAFWRYREEISMSLLKYTPYKYDLAVKPSNIPNVIEVVDSLFKQQYPNFEIIWFGHVGDGNLHLNVLRPEHMPKDHFFSFCECISDSLFEIIQKFHGTISAEHGIGLLKRGYLHYTKSKLEIEYMRGLKKIFDPMGIMNPGKLLEE